MVAGRTSKAEGQETVRMTRRIKPKEQTGGGVADILGISTVLTAFAFMVEEQSGCQSNRIPSRLYNRFYASNG